MNIFDYIIIFTIALCVVSAIVFMLRQRKKGKMGCCAGCDGCCSGCSKR